MAKNTDSLSTRERLIAEASRRFAQYGFEGASIGSIATDAGIRKASVYYFFANKAALYLAVVDHVLQEMIDLFSQDPSPAPRRIFGKTIRRSIALGVSYGFVLHPVDERVFQKRSRDLAAVCRKQQQLQRSLKLFMRRCGIRQAAFAAELIPDANRSFIIRNAYAPSDRDIATYVRNLMRFVFSD
jgi:AcrR family transcriptional regulator